MKCQSCGAMIDPGAYECPFCKAPTPRAAEYRAAQERDAAARAQWDAQRAWQEQNVLRLKMEGAAKQSMLLSIAGIVVCCTPLGIGGIVQGVRAKKMAETLKTPAPGSATFGLVLGILSTLWSAGFLTWAMIQSHYDQESTQEHVAKLKQKVGDKAQAASLDHGTACALAEIHALETGFDGHPGYSLDKFQCPGKLNARPDGAELETFRFGWSTSTKYDVNVCFKKGAKWYVTDMRKGACP